MTTGPGRTLRLDIAYDGTDFSGWQIQPEARTVQGELARALGTILGEAIVPAGAGRTDAGVHATGQVASFHTANAIPLDGLRRALAALLPVDVQVRRVTEAPDGFHARFGATRRTYRYRIVTRLSPFRRRYAWVRRRMPDAGRLTAAMSPWLGRHSFHAFTQGEGRDGDTHCTIVRADWACRDDRWVLTLAADRFLYRMVRTVVAVLVDAFERDALSPEAMAALVEPGAVRPRVAPAPAAGLFLVRVDYPASPPRPALPWEEEGAGLE
jgi:tRNA pseudouridine38-40 synthase